MPTYYPATQAEIDAALAAFYSGAPIPNGFAVNLTWPEKVRRIDPDAPVPAWPGWFSDFVPGPGQIVVGGVSGPEKHDFAADVALTSAVQRVDPGSTGSNREFLGWRGGTPLKKLPAVHDVYDYGATGGANDSTFIQDAIDTAAEAGGGTVQLRETHNANIVAKPGVMIRGVGRGTPNYPDAKATVLKPAVAGPIITAPTAEVLGFGNLENLMLWGNPGDATNDGIYLPRGTGTSSGPFSGASEIAWRDVRIIECGRHGIFFEGGNVYQAQQWHTFENIKVEYCRGYGVFSQGFLQNCLFLRLGATSNLLGGWRDEAWQDSGGAWQFSEMNTFIRCNFESNGTYFNSTGEAHGFWSAGIRNAFIGTWVEANGLTDSAGGSCGMVFDASASGVVTTANKVIGGHFADCFYDIRCVAGHGTEIDGNTSSWSSRPGLTKIADIALQSAGSKVMLGKNIPSGFGTHLQYSPADRANVGVLGIVDGNHGVGTDSPTSRLHVDGSIATAVITVNSAYTLSSVDSVVAIDATAADVPITLPLSSTCVGRQYVFKQVGGTHNGVLTAQSGDSIEGAPTTTVGANQVVRLVAFNGTWRPM